MAAMVNMPKLGFDMAEGTLVRWLRAEGEEIKKGEVLAEIETDKATVEVEFEPGRDRSQALGGGGSQRSNRHSHRRDRRPRRTDQSCRTDRKTREGGGSGRAKLRERSRTSGPRRSDRSRGRRSARGWTRAAGRGSCFSPGAKDGGGERDRLAEAEGHGTRRPDHKEGSADRPTDTCWRPGPSRPGPRGEADAGEGRGPAGSN